jgi:hypothetical protein
MLRRSYRNLMVRYYLGAQNNADSESQGMYLYSVNFVRISFGQTLLILAKASVFESVSLQVNLFGSFLASSIFHLDQHRLLTVGFHEVCYILKLHQIWLNYTR